MIFLYDSYRQSKFLPPKMSWRANWKVCFKNKKKKNDRKKLSVCDFAFAAAKTVVKMSSRELWFLHGLKKIGEDITP